MLKYRIDIDREACNGDRLCGEEAPNTFGLDKEGKAVVVDPQGDPPEYIRAAAKSCPLEGITLRDAVTGQQVWPRL